MPYRILVVMILLFTGNNMYSQPVKTQVVPWYFPGIIYKANSKLELWGQFGLNYRQHIHAAYLQAFIKTGKHFTLNPGYLYLNIERPNGSHLHDHTLMNSVILNFSLSKLLIDDRNMLWNRFRQQEKDIHFYRNRLRFTLPLQKGAILFKPYLFDEITFSFNEGYFTRNRLAAGLNCKVTRWLLLDITWLLEHDRYNGTTDLLFIQALIHLGKS